MKISRKYIVLASLYIVQSVPFSFIKTGFQALLRDLEMTHAEISRVIGILMLPWVVKFLWAPFVDRWCANRLPKIRQTILLFQLVGAAILGVVATLDFPDNLQQISIVFFLLSFVAATQDIAVDALAVLTLPKNEHGLGNTAQMGGYYMGEVLGGALILIVLDNFGWNWAMGAFIIFFLIPFVPVYLYKNDNYTPPPPPKEKGLATISSFLKQPGILFWLVVMVIYMGNQVLSRTLLPSLLTDMGYNKTEIGTLNGIWGNSASLVGAVIGGLIINKLGRKNSLVGFGLLKVIAVFGFLALTSKTVSVGVTYTVIIFNDFASGLATVTLFTIMMDKCRLSSPGSDFTIQQCTNMIAVLIFVIISGSLVSRFEGNFTVLFYVAIVMGLVGVLLAGFGLSRKSLDNGSGLSGH